MLATLRSLHRRTSPNSGTFAHATARGGLGLSIEETRGRLRLVERIVSLLPDDRGAYAQWKAIVFAKEVKDVQVHDARLVALMNASGVTHLLSLNAPDFARYDGITAVSLSGVL